MLRGMIAAVAAWAVLLPVQASAQAGGEVILHSKGHFKGARRIIAGPRQHIEPPFVMRSVTIPSGAVWEFCSGNTFSGCRQFSQSVPATVMTVRSARPVAAVLPSTATTLPTGATIRGQSLRGMSSEYFVTPETGGVRVEVQPNTAEAMTRRAGEFCRSRGWRSSAYERLQTVAGRVYLADVLCVDTEQ